MQNHKILLYRSIISHRDQWSCWKFQDKKNYKFIRRANLTQLIYLSANLKIIFHYVQEWPNSIHCYNRIIYNQSYSIICVYRKLLNRLKKLSSFESSTEMILLINFRVTIFYSLLYNIFNKLIVFITWSEKWKDHHTNLPISWSRNIFLTKWFIKGLHRVNIGHTMIVSKNQKIESFWTHISF